MFEKQNKWMSRKDNSNFATIFLMGVWFIYGTFFGILMMVMFG